MTQNKSKAVREYLDCNFPRWRTRKNTENIGSFPELAQAISKESGLSIEHYHVSSVWYSERNKIKSNKPTEVSSHGSKGKNIRLYLEKHPEARVADVAEKFDATPAYVYTIKNESKSTQKKDSRPIQIEILDSSPKEDLNSFVATLVAGAPDPVSLALCAINRVYRENAGGLGVIVQEVMKLTLGNSVKAA
jgi:hypothetical protein